MPSEFPTVIEGGGLRLSRYVDTDADPLFAALCDPAVWEHIPHPIPTASVELHRHLAGKLATGDRLTFTIRLAGVVVGMTSILFDGDEPDGAEIGGTQLTRSVWAQGST